MYLRGSCCFVLAVGGHCTQSLVVVGIVLVIVVVIVLFIVVVIVLFTVVLIVVRVVVVVLVLSKVINEIQMFKRVSFLVCSFIRWLISVENNCLQEIKLPSKSFFS